MAKGSNRAEALADRIWTTVRPQIVRIIREEMAQAGSSDPVDLSDRDLDQAEQVARKWGAR